jgi:GNAT superfamily N-acetyltransferase
VAHQPWITAVPQGLNVLYQLWIEGQEYPIEVGCVRIEPRSDGFCLSGMLIKPEFRRQGWGTMLLSRVLRDYTGKHLYGVAQSFGTKPVSERALIKFYRHSGMTVTRNLHIASKP